MIYLAEKLSHNIRVIVIDIPGLGTRRNETLSMENSIGVLRETIDRLYVLIKLMRNCVKYNFNFRCSPDEKVFIAGFEIGGYIAMNFTRIYPDYCKGVILSGCSLEYPPYTSSIYLACINLLVKLTPNEKLWCVIPEIYDMIPRERINRALLRDGINYSKWGEFATLVKESKEGYYRECLSIIPHNILFINAEYDYRSSESKFMEAASNRGKLIVLECADRMYIIEDYYISEMSQEIIKFINSNNKV